MVFQKVGHLAVGGGFGNDANALDMRLQQRPVGARQTSVVVRRHRKTYSEPEQRFDRRQIHRQMAATNERVDLCGGRGIGRHGGSLEHWIAAPAEELSFSWDP